MELVESINKNILQLRLGAREVVKELDEAKHDDINKIGYVLSKYAYTARVDTGVINDAYHKLKVVFQDKIDEIKGHIDNLIIKSRDVKNIDQELKELMKFRFIPELGDHLFNLTKHRENLGWVIFVRINDTPFRTTLEWQMRQELERLPLEGLLKRAQSEESGVSAMTISAAMEVPELDDEEAKLGVQRVRLIEALVEKHEGKKMNFGRTIKLEGLTAYDNLFKVKIMIQRKTVDSHPPSGIPRNEQHLRLVGHMQTAQITSSRETVSWSLGARNTTMRIFIRTKDVKTDTLALDVNGSDNIGNVKAKIQEKMDFRMDHSVLYFLGKKLEDARTLKAYNIQSGSTLWLTLRPVLEFVALERMTNLKDYGRMLGHSLLEYGIKNHSVLYLARIENSGFSALDEEEEHLMAALETIIERVADDPSVEEEYSTIQARIEEIAAVRELMKLGFSKANATVALKEKAGALKRAAEWLFSEREAGRID